MSRTQKGDQSWSTHTVGYYSASEKKEILIYATVSVNQKTVCSVKYDRHKRTNTL